MSWSYEYCVQNKRSHVSFTTQFRDLHTNLLTGYLPESICDISAFQVYDNLFWCPFPDCCTNVTCGTCIDRPPSPSPSPSPPLLPEGELDTLWELYNLTDGPHWRNNDNWLSGDPCAEEWFGVKCNINGSHVLRLYVLILYHLNYIANFTLDMEI